MVATKPEQKGTCEKKQLVTALLAAAVTNCYQFHYQLDKT